MSARNTSTLNPGTVAPEISLARLDGADFRLSRSLERGPAILAFFKVSCPVCQFTMPYLERIYRAYPEGKYTLVGVAQDDEDATRGFARQYGLTFPLALDPEDSYPASNAYGLTNVPTIFLVGADGGIQRSILGWDRRDMEGLNATVARASAISPAPLLQPDEDVPASKAG